MPPIFLASAWSPLILTRRELPKTTARAPPPRLSHRATGRAHSPKRRDLSSCQTWTLLVSPIEIDCCRIATTYDNGDAFPGLWSICPRITLPRMSCRSPRLRDNTQCLPEHILSLPNRLIGHKNGTMHIGLRDWKYALPDAAWRWRVRRQATCFRIYGMAGLQRLGKRRGGKGFDADDLDTAGIPRSDSRDQAATSDRDEERVDIFWRLAIDLPQPLRVSPPPLALL